MKNKFFKLITLLYLFILASCGTSLERPKSNTDYNNIIGKTIKIDNLEVAQYDFPNKIKWYDANKACSELGDGWRLPTEDELNTLYQNKNEIGNFTGDYYWSSTENGNTGAKYHNFSNDEQNTNNKNGSLYVRAVRAF